METNTLTDKQIKILIEFYESELIKAQKKVDDIKTKIELLNDLNDVKI